MALIEAVRRALGDARAGSFQLMGEDLSLVSGQALLEAAAAYQRGLDDLPPAVRERFVREQESLLGEVHAFLRTHNRSIHTRIRGYLALGQRLAFEYPWPVVAMLGICQVLEGITFNRRFAFLAPALRRLGSRTLDELVENTEDVLRRTNRGIFADSVPTVLTAVRVHELRLRGEHDVAEALLDGPLPPLMDEENRMLARQLSAGLAISGARERFDALSEVTLRHFDREQAIFTHHMNARRDGAPRTKARGLLNRALALRSVMAPTIERRGVGGGDRHVVFARYELPRGFDMREHETRVELFADAFVKSVTREPEDYRAAVRYVVKRFG
jgi:hypothetical protein